MEQAAQGGDRVTIPGGVQETSGHDTWCYGRVDRVVIGQRLDSMILEVFSNLNDSVTLGFSVILFLYSLIPCHFLGNVLFFLLKFVTSLM